VIVPITRYIYAAALVSITCVAAIVYNTIFWEAFILYYVATLSIGTALHFILLQKVQDIPIKLFWLITIIIHAIALFGIALYEDDYFRFIWDGWQTLNGTPYGIPPAHFYADENIPGNLWPVLDYVNNPEVPTIYGPTLQFIFAAIYWLAGTDPMGLRIIFALCNLILIAILLKRHSPAITALYAWCPLVVVETIVHIHPDIVMVLFLAAGLWCIVRHPIWAGIFWGTAAATKIIALAAWPLMLRWPKKALFSAIITCAILYGYFALLGPSLGFDSTSTFANTWLFNPMGLDLLAIFVSEHIARLLAALIGIILILFIHARTRDKNYPPLAAIFGIILFFAPAVNSWYMIWMLPFAIHIPKNGRRLIWPFVAASFIPLSYITGLTLDTETLREFEVHPAAWWSQVIIILTALSYDLIQSKQKISDKKPLKTRIEAPYVAIIIPALNEEESIANMVRSIKGVGENWDHEPYIIVADNGSHDKTAILAKDAGAHIVYEQKQGYGAACLAGLSALPDHINIILFMDADGSDVPEEANALINPIISGDADMVIGSRALGHIEAGAMTPPQRFGNWLATRLVKLIWQQDITDLGPFRAIRRDALQSLQMVDQDFGWTIEMQVKAIQHDLRVKEQPADYRKRLGISKISGTVKGVFGAGSKILYIIAREAYFR